ncbi:hypothetical protein K4H28_15110 [Deefgea tanakiae]|uniref:Uncharacterized protein n=1 Tax=Deefgea tanakiae TaxID=2865840 RepID=A0ABX8Z9L8_9NEIS|nr:hypothetical protein [Deefgea tanakiae]QZA77584.1 hypothetical protein K4H28_15110 [Deefgea tanakiae]
MSFLAKELGISAGVISATIVIVIVMILKMNELESVAGMKATTPIIIGIDPIVLRVLVDELSQKLNSFVPQRAVRMIMPLAWKAKVFHRVDSLVLA